MASKAFDRPAADPLLPGTARRLAVAVVVVCVLVTTAQAVWIRYGMETSWLNAAVDTRVKGILGGHHVLLAMLVWPGGPVPVAAMTAALVLICLALRRFRVAALAAISVPIAVGLTEFVLKPLIGWTSWGTIFPSGHVTGVVAVVAALIVLLAKPPVPVPRQLRLALALTASLVAAAVAVGVIGANMHHFTDTVGGAAVGAGTVLLTALLIDLLCRRRSQRRNLEAPAT